MKQSTKFFLILAIIGSFSFLSCNKKGEEKLSEKQQITYYPKEKFNNVPEEYRDTTKTYMDIYYGDEYPKGEEIDFDDLSEPEKEEFYKTTLNDEYSGTLYRKEIKIIKPSGKRKLLSYKYKIIGFNDGSDKSIYFLNEFDVLPTFPGCELNSKQCFIDSVTKHFFKYFNEKSLHKLDLPKGNLKVTLGFTVNNRGYIVYGAAEAPKRPLVLELVRVINLLPKMRPAELNGKKVSVKYQIPITILVD
ncbi:MAG: hypothetical protein WAO74_07720 [Polaribacter sp.]|uniref:hypothetical protein n=1 Tax=Polaribacter sp. TaxID=1920175 RepID=UPI003BB1E5A4